MGTDNLTFHKDLTGDDLHVPGCVQDNDPGAQGYGKLWVDTNLGTLSYILKIRNATNTGWSPVAQLWGQLQGNILNQTDLIDYIATHGGSGGGTWGTITGTLENQIDLRQALDSKSPVNHSHTLDALSNVGVTSGLSNGQILYYDMAQGLWINWTPTFVTVETDPLSLHLDQASSQHVIGGEPTFDIGLIAGREYISGIQKSVTQPTAASITINYAKPTPTNASITEGAPGGFICNLNSTTFYVYGYTTWGDTTTYTNYPLQFPFSDSGTIYTSPNPSGITYLGAGEYYATYSIVTPVNLYGYETRTDYSVDASYDYGSYADTSSGSFYNMAVSIVVYSYRTAGDLTRVHNQATPFVISDYTSTNFAVQCYVNWAYGAEGFVIEATVGLDTYWLDMGSSNYAYLDGAFSGWTVGTYWDSGYVSSPYYWGGSYMYGVSNSYSVYSFIDTPVGRVYSSMPASVSPSAASYDYSGFALYWDYDSNANGYRVLRSSDGYSYDTTNNSMIDDGSSWSSDNNTSPYYIDYGGIYNYGDYIIYDMYTYVDTPQGRVYSSLYDSTAIYIYNSTRGVYLSWNLLYQGETGYHLLRSKDSGSTWAGYDVGYSSSFIDDGNYWGWTTTMDPNYLPKDFSFDLSYTLTGSHTGSFVVFYDTWNTFSPMIYDAGTSTSMNINSSNISSLSSYPTESNWYASNNSVRPTTLENADGVTRSISLYNYKTYAGVTTYSVPTLVQATPYTSADDTFYMDVSWSNGIGATGTKLKYGSNYKVLATTYFSTNTHTYGDNSTVTPTPYYSTNTKIWSDYWSIDENGYSFMGTSTDASNVTSSGTNIFTGTASFRGLIVEPNRGYDRVDIGYVGSAPAIIMEDGGYNYWKIYSSSGTLAFLNSGSDKVHFSSTVATFYSSLSVSIQGVLTCGSILKITDGNAGAPSLTFTNDPNTGLYRYAADVIGLATAGVFRAYFSTAAFYLSDGFNIQTGTATGTKIGNSTANKISFYNATPIIQPLATLEIGTVLSNLGLRAAGTAYPITTSGTVTAGAITTTGTGTFGDIKAVNSGTITRSATTGLVSSLTITGKRTLTFTRNAVGYVTRMTDGTNTWNYTRDINNNITAWAVS